MTQETSLLAFPPDESGGEAWLRYPRLCAADASALQALCTVNACPGAEAALSELDRALAGWGLPPRTDGDGLSLSLDPALPEEGFCISRPSPQQVRLAGGSPRGLLYGMFHLLRCVNCGLPLEGASAPAVPLRMINHWDNLVCDPVHGSIERVKGGDTIFDWTDLARPNPRYEEYARLLASVGLNATCLNNVNAEPEILSTDMIRGLAALASVFRPWGLRIFISVNFATPVLLGELDTADPLDARVQDWWRNKADEIYAAIPDFGGFVVKADSEGKPGPGTYGRNHVEGSACLARALAPHGGTLFWRTFVYGRNLADKLPDPKARADRANHATHEFMGLDGQFEENVILQIKCSAIDFQIWEPVHALFGKLSNTRMCVEFALTKEYSGLDVHMNWEGPYVSEILRSPLVAGRMDAVTAVANLNNSRNGFGHLLHGASLYTHGRLAWRPDADPRAVLDEYTVQMFGPEAGPAVSEMMADSYDTVASYTMPMGMTYISEFLHHFEPDPWANHDGAGITADGIGVDRTAATGSGYIGLYPPELAGRFEDPATCPLRCLLYFHHLPWTHSLPGGETLIQSLYDSYCGGVETVRGYRRQWRALHGQIDLERWAHVCEKLALKERHAERWRDLVCRFLEEISGIKDAQGRFDAPSVHNRVRSGYRQAFEDYRARVERERGVMRRKPI
ncbi:MAG: alpha-glucuronidase [Verrucomicrobia bacterium]|nr:alpha-glucuronidase [Verrucomicrobiota bacterium]MCH8525626.1 alpha-glucuronidase [Kiritimatiellia bacterium]